jgi:hypothetical protein
MAMFLLFARHLRQAKMERVHCVIRGHAHNQVGLLLPLPSIPAFHGFFGDRFGVLPLTSGFKCIIPPFPTSSSAHCRRLLVAAFMSLCSCYRLLATHSMQVRNLRYTLCALFSSSFRTAQ